jgi:uncharacterized membrane protein
MSKAEYLAAIDSLLGFMSASARAEVAADMEELYDGLSERGMSDLEVQQRIGTPRAVASEYRLAEQIDRVERSPGAGAGFRMGFATLSGQIARGAAFQLLGLLWFALSLTAIALGVTVIVGILIAIGILVGFEPVAATLAVPGIPVASSTLMGLTISAAAFAFLLGNRLTMRALSRLMRRYLRRRQDRDPEHGHGPDSQAEQTDSQSATADRPSGWRHWINTGRAAWQTALAALALGVLSASLMPVLDGPEYPLVVDRTAVIELGDSDLLRVEASDVDIRLIAGDEASARLTADLKRTFGQAVDLQIDLTGAAPHVTATYREGLSWGINARPVLVVTLPTDRPLDVEVSASGGDVDLSDLPASMRNRVTLEQ